MKIICAGLPKTGTKSLGLALKILGYKVHDVDEHWGLHLSEFHQALFEKKMPDFRAMYSGVDVVVASPACYFWREIMKSFPDSQVILTVRDNEDAWLESIRKAILSVQMELSQNKIRLGMILTPTGRKWWRIIQVNFIRFKNHGFYAKHNSGVKQCVRQGKLLEFHVKQGWKPLCDFLGVAEPDITFPYKNKENNDITRQYQGMVAKKMYRELIVLTSVIVFLTSCIFFIIWRK